MKPLNTLSTVRGLLLSALLAAAAVPAMAQVSFSIYVGPPAPMYEAVPVMAPGYVWAPGYWAWHGDRHIWVHGRSIVQRVGYRWEPDVWEQRNNAYYRHPGRWEHDMDYRPMGNVKFKKSKDRDDDGDHDGPGNSGKKHKGNKHEG